MDAAPATAPGAVTGGGLAEASRLHPDSWSMWRQAADKTELGLAGGPDFWERVKALGDKSYYPPPDLPGFPGARRD